MKKLGIFGGVLAAVLLLWLCCLPRHLLEGVAYSTVVLDRDGALLGARVADDGQWRFPMETTWPLPEKFVQALVEFEDHRFYDHAGVSLRALLRATVQNLRNGRVVSGGSTITMQLVRISRQKPRTVWQKVVEIFLATRVELRYSKEEILQLYAAHAPFGGNVVGLRAALWRYFGSDAVELSWAEAATLAVLQNAPALIHLERNREALLAKRNRLLDRLLARGVLSQEDHALALEEPLIGKPYPMPQYAPHWVELHHKLHHGQQIRTSLDLTLQQRVEALALRWSQELRQRGIRDLAIVVQEEGEGGSFVAGDSGGSSGAVAGQAVVAGGHSAAGAGGASFSAVVDCAIASGATLGGERVAGGIVAYCGNADLLYDRPGKWVDVARAPRSSGSILKPLLYAAALQEGVLLPETLLPDVPTDFGGFAPKNFDGTYAGAVPADEALALSLNIPLVYLLQKFGVARFAKTLQRAGFVSLDRPADDYGLSLILGGAEVRLVDVVNAYAQLAAGCLTAAPVGDLAAESFAGDLAAGSVTDNSRVDLDAGPPVRDLAVGSSVRDLAVSTLPDFPLSNPWACYYTLEALREVNRPDQMDWRRVASVQQVAWKTGTSYGSRDAWAVGVTPRYAVGVWVGNADGSGAPDLTGARCAGPILFEIFHLLPNSGWFPEPAAPDTSAALDSFAASGATSANGTERATLASSAERANSAAPTEVTLTVCRHSGHRAGRFCKDRVAVCLPANAVHSDICPYCQEAGFVLPPVLQHYCQHPVIQAATTHPSTTTGPTRSAYPSTTSPVQATHPSTTSSVQATPPSTMSPARASHSSTTAASFAILYPTQGSVLSLARQLDGTPGSFVCKAVHTAPDAELFWHLDASYLGTTTHVHQLTLQPAPGYHRLTLVDPHGHTQTVEFVVR